MTCLFPSIFHVVEMIYHTNNCVPKILIDLHSTDKHSLGCHKAAIKHALEYLSIIGGKEKHKIEFYGVLLSSIWRISQ